jgi:glycerophosphoryl diester phosphodiesterase
MTKTLVSVYLLCMVLLEACGTSLQNGQVKPHANITSTYIVAHRGYSVAAPENTMPAFESAYQVGAEAIEYDMQVTRDSHVIILHDQTVNRTTNGKGKIIDLTSSQVEKLDAGYRFSPRFRGTKVPTLLEILDFAQKHPALAMFAEIKHYRTPADIRLMIEPFLALGLESRTVVTAFSVSDLHTVRQISPKIGIGYLCASQHSTLDAYQLAQNDPNTWVMVSAPVLVNNPTLTQQAASRHIRLVAWTVDQEHLLDDLEFIGVHRFVTDNPKLIELTS